MAFMVPRVPYSDYVLSQADEEDVSLIFPSEIATVDD